MATRYSKYGISLTARTDINALDALTSGKISIQDEAAQLATSLLDLRAGQRVLDACAAPGGKTCHILESADELDVVALEHDANRAERIHENLDRLNLNARVLVADATDIGTWHDGRLFDRILLDAPCSATGVIRRHPDIKLLRRPDDLAKLAEVQRALLQSLWACLKPGGIFVYATCSVLKQENEHTVAAFIQSQPDAKHVPIEADWGQSRPFGRQLFPQQGGHDGFYYAKLCKG